MTRTPNRTECEACGSLVVEPKGDGVLECLECGEFFEEDDFARQNDPIRTKKYRRDDIP